MLKEQLDIPVAQSTFWSDSTCVLQYIRNQSKRFHTFVANRLTVIHENSEPHQWRHVSSELNLADGASRGLTVDEMILNKRWLSGPQFLKEEKEFWPLDYSLQHQELPDDDQEVKRDPDYQCQILMRGDDRNVLSRFIGRCSSWENLRRTVAWLLRFKSWFIGQCSPSPVSTVCTSAKPSILSVDEVRVAEREVLRHVKRLSFPEVFQALQGLGQLSSPRQVMSELKDLKTTASMRKLHRFMNDKGILQVGGRLENALIEYEAKHPIILPYRNRVTDLIILQHHQPAGHLSQEYVLSSPRQLYWIIKGRSAVHGVIGDFFLCKKLGAVRGEQLMADLPKKRLMSGDPPFTHVGVRYFGPFYVRQGRS